MKVLVDSSVWIEYFRNGNIDDLDRLIKEDLVVTNEIILTELLPSIHNLGHKSLEQSISSLPKIELAIDWLILRNYQLLNLQKGINKVGIPDLIILQQVIENNLTLFTYEKHFKLMSEYLELRLY